MATATKKPKTKKTSAKKPAAKKTAPPKHKAKKESAVKVRVVAAAEFTSAISLIRHGIRSDWDDAQIVKMVTEKFPSYKLARIPADIRWHRNPKHADDLQKGMKKTA